MDSFWTRCPAVAARRAATLLQRSTVASTSATHWKLALPKHRSRARAACVACACASPALAWTASSGWRSTLLGMLPCAAGCCPVAPAACCAQAAAACSALPRMPPIPSISRRLRPRRQRHVVPFATSQPSSSPASTSGPTLYTLLELEPNCEPADIRKAYRRLAAVCHPDRDNSAAAQLRFQVPAGCRAFRRFPACAAAASNAFVMWLAVLLSRVSATPERNKCFALSHHVETARAGTC